MGETRYGKFSPLLRTAVRAVPGVLLLLLMAAPLRGQARAALAAPPPDYPPLAVRMRISGAVMVATTIDSAGNVSEAHATVGHAMLRPAAERCVLHWKFASAATPSEMNIEVRFHLEGPNAR